MKIEIKFIGRDEFAIDENFAGVATYTGPHSGKYLVESIESVSVIGDLLYICATERTKDAPKPVDPETPVVNAEPVAVEF